MSAAAMISSPRVEPHSSNRLFDVSTVEAKSGSTVAATACDTINWWTSLPGNPNRGGVLVHGGDWSLDFKGVRVLPWFIGS